MSKQRQMFANQAQEKLDKLTAASDHEVLERAWDEISNLCGHGKESPKQWTMHVPVDADRDSDIIFGEVLRRFGDLAGYSRT